MEHERERVQRLLTVPVALSGYLIDADEMQEGDGPEGAATGDSVGDAFRDEGVKNLHFRQGVLVPGHLTGA